MAALSQSRFRTINTPDKLSFRVPYDSPNVCRAFPSGDSGSRIDFGFHLAFHFSSVFFLFSPFFLSFSRFCLHYKRLIGELVAEGIVDKTGAPEGESVLLFITGGGELNERRGYAILHVSDVRNSPRIIYEYELTRFSTNFERRKAKTLFPSFEKSRTSRQKGALQFVRIRGHIIRKGMACRTVCRQSGKFEDRRRLSEEEERRREPREERLWVRKLACVARKKSCRPSSGPVRNALRVALADTQRA